MKRGVSLVSYDHEDVEEEEEEAAHVEEDENIEPPRSETASQSQQPLSLQVRGISFVHSLVLLATHGEALLEIFEKRPDEREKKNAARRRWLPSSSCGQWRW